MTDDEGLTLEKDVWVSLVGGGNGRVPQSSAAPYGITFFECVSGNAETKSWANSLL